MNTTSPVINDALRTARFILPLLLLALLTGCASGMSKDECRTANWELIGYADGSKGYSTSLIDRHRKACAGVSSPVLADYLKGHARGMRQFCTESNGYYLGKRGAPVAPQCPDDLRETFQVGFRFGQKVYNANLAVNRLIKRLRDSKQRRVNKEQRKFQLESEILRPGLSSSQRADIVWHLRQVQQKLDDLDERIDKQEVKLYRAIVRLNRINKRNRYENVIPRSMPDIQVSADQPRQSSRQRAP